MPALLDKKGSRCGENVCAGVDLEIRENRSGVWRGMISLYFRLKPVCPAGVRLKLTDGPEL